MHHSLISSSIAAYLAHLQGEERAAATIAQYARALRHLEAYVDARPLDKGRLIAWKELLTQTYAPSTVNTMLAAVNGWLSFSGRSDLRLRPLRIQRSAFSDARRELSRQEYARLVRTAEKRGNLRLALVLQTLCATGIRVSELSFITAEAVKTGRAQVHNKGKHRLVFLPAQLCTLLRRYLRAKKRRPAPSLQREPVVRWIVPISGAI